EPARNFLANCQRRVPLTVHPIIRCPFPPITPCAGESSLPPKCPELKAPRQFRRFFIGVIQSAERHEFATYCVLPPEYRVPRKAFNRFTKVRVAFNNRKFPLMMTGLTRTFHENRPTKLGLYLGQSRFPFEAHASGREVRNQWRPFVQLAGSKMFFRGIN